MNALRILILCVTAALVCASVRTLHPQIASAIALATGCAALILSLSDIRAFSDTLQALENALPESGTDGMLLLRLCGIALIAEFASDICRDSGEAALARRIDVGTKLAMLAAALPMSAQLMNAFTKLLQ